MESGFVDQDSKGVQITVMEERVGPVTLLSCAHLHTSFTRDVNKHALGPWAFQHMPHTDSVNLLNLLNLTPTLIYIAATSASCNSIILKAGNRAARLSSTAKCRLVTVASLAKT